MIELVPNTKYLKKTYKCDRCGRQSLAYYILSTLTKALWIKCDVCKNHAAPYIPSLDLPYIPSKTYLKEFPEIKEALHEEFPPNKPRLQSQQTSFPLG